MPMNEQELDIIVNEWADSLEPTAWWTVADRKTTFRPRKQFCRLLWNFEDWTLETELSESNQVDLLQYWLVTVEKPVENFFTKASMDWPEQLVLPQLQAMSGLNPFDLTLAHAVFRDLCLEAVDEVKSKFAAQVEANMEELTRPNPPTPLDL